LSHAILDLLSHMRFGHLLTKINQLVKLFKGFVVNLSFRDGAVSNDCNVIAESNDSDFALRTTIVYLTDLLLDHLVDVVLLGEGIRNVPSSGVIHHWGGQIYAENNCRALQGFRLFLFSDLASGFRILLNLDLVYRMFDVIDVVDLRNFVGAKIEALILKSTKLADPLI